MLNLTHKLPGEVAEDSDTAFWALWFSDHKPVHFFAREDDAYAAGEALASNPDEYYEVLVCAEP